MNERIRLLAEQANIEFTYDPTETPVRAFAECWADDLEKFAELIVMECASIVENQGRFLPYLVLCKEVKKKFGIRE